ncbi:asparagine synthase (glutamine-hydrolyzing) [Alkaliphilus metalliredigens QYMF]|uniref:asparagine synthase (glutamine-hydrolyzing) n=1 Tax=Alkaliphilus metalliredigens (strain QYMF) TaxID=293826 RepID=A6TWB0_ALKMQ|nr:asparagine synthase (glutamine-hydrolyzing) [Alkaliphilus metalliredigens]ABR50478.1 asparagine synthase (glutamine-hydrolyzing) [Alkaliphilus metalliredigens QYMF]
MCGIAGWIDYQRDLRDENPIIERMTASLGHRGPDTKSSYISKHGLLGHRRLIVVDPSGGAQPMTKRLGEKTYTMVYNGELYNTEDLRKELKDKGHTFNSYSDTEVLLVAYMEWGENCVQHLNGIYAFGIWNEVEKTVFLARDRLGVKPLFYNLKNGGLFFASEIKALLAHPEIDPVVTTEGLCEVFGLGPARSPGNGVFKDINEIKPGYCLTYTPQGVKIKSYWQLESKPHEDSLGDTIENVRGLLIDAIERQLVSDVPICTFLSGGLDSSAIASVTANAFKRDGRGQLHTYSIDYVDNDQYFKPSEFQPNADSEWIGRMVSHIDSKHHDIIIDTPQLTEALEAAVLSTDLPGMADVDSSLYLFCKNVKQNDTVALSGECADEIFGGYPWFRRREDIEANTFPWSKATTERRNILSGDLRKLPLEEYVATKYEETLREVPRMKGESLETHRMREIFYLNMKWFMITLLNRKDRMSMANGLEVRVPFADHRIVEYAWNIPWEMKYLGQREKGLLRSALKDILPEDVRTRKKSPYPKTHNPAYLKAVQQWMGEIMQDPSSPILQVINQEKVKEIVETGGKSFGKPWFGQLMTGPQLIAYLIQVNLWMKHYNVSIE